MSFKELCPITYFKKIEMLDCSYNQLENLEAIRDLTKLKILDCSYNKLNRIDAIKNLKCI